VEQGSLSIAPSPLRIPSPASAELPIAALLEAQGDIIDVMARGTPLREALKHIALLVERLAPPALCTILLLDADGRHLRHGAGPSLPDQFMQATDPLEIGPSVGSCGTAAFRKTPVIVSDIATDPLWELPRDFVLSFGLRACWSMPIMNDAGVVLGTIAMYYREPRAPTGRDFGLLEPASRLVRLALAQHRQEQELRESEARFRLATEAAGLGAYDISLATGKHVWSDRFKSILGLPSSTDMSRERLSAAIHPDERPRFAAAFDRWIDPTSHEQHAEEFRILRADDGAERSILLKGRVLTNSRGAPYRAIGTCSDITELRAAERQQRQAERQLHHAQKLEGLGRLAGGIAHDLNNTLVPILALAKTSKNRVSPDDSMHRTFTLIHQAAERARDLVSQVVAFSRHEEIQREAVNLSSLVQASMALLRASIPSTVRIEERIAAEPVIWGNQGQLHQVITNLVTNAAAAIGTSIGTITIEVSLHSVASVEPWHRTTAARLSVTDTGAGMDPATLQRLFEPFFTTKPVGEGTGLGLSVVHGIVLGHGGTIEATSRLGHGSRFDIVLPLHDEAKAIASRLEQKTQAAGA
jgi:PAS domain S-box-containing protein